MIKIYITKKEDNITHILISGHAMYDDYGKDIVCAGVSSIVITTINAILAFAETIQVKDNQDLEIIVLKNDNITNTLLQNMVDLLNSLESKYKENISIRTKGK